MRKLIIFVGVILMSLMMSACAKAAEPENIDENSAKSLEIEKARQIDFAKSHGFSDPILMMDYMLTNRLTVDIQNDLEGKTIVVVNSIKDIYEKDGRILLDTEMFYDDVVYRLDCTDVYPAIKNEIGKEDSSYTDFTILAEIIEVHKFGVEYYADGDPENGYDVNLGSSDIRIIDGKCVAVTKVVEGK